MRRDPPRLRRVGQDEGAGAVEDLHDSRGRTLAYLVKADGWEDYSVEAARAGAAHSYVYGDRPAARYEALSRR